MLASWRPFLDPINGHDWWYLLLLPLALGISIAYKAVRVRTMDHYWREVLVMTVQLVAAMIVLAIAAYVLLIVIIPRIVPMDV